MIFLAGSVLVGALNYLYYPLIGRLVSPAAFGEIQTLVSLFLQFTIFLNVLGMITVNIMANYTNKEKAHKLIVELEKFAAYLSLFLLAFSLLGGEMLRQMLQFDSSLPFAALALALMVSIPLTFRSAYARSQKKFGIAVASQLIGSVSKLVFSAGLVIIGLGTLGAIGGIVAAQFIAFLYAARWAGRLGFLRPKNTNYASLPDIRTILPELKYAGLVFIGLLSITLLMSVDMLIVKYFFDAETAGLYAGIATVGRIIFFLSAPIAQVLMPSIKIQQNSASNRKLLIKSLGLTILVTSPVLLVCMLIPETVVSLLMGGAYDHFTHLLPLLAAAIFLLSITNLLCMYSLSLREKGMALISTAGLLLSLGLMIFHHDSPADIVSNLFAGSLAIVTIGGIYMLARTTSKHAAI
jgi:O-antigen/teichoic acid export membrane protein